MIESRRIKEIAKSNSKKIEKSVDDGAISSSKPGGFKEMERVQEPFIIDIIHTIRADEWVPEAAKESACSLVLPDGRLVLLDVGGSCRLAG